MLGLDDVHLVGGRRLLGTEEAHALTALDDHIVQEVHRSAGTLNETPHRVGAGTPHRSTHDGLHVLGRIGHVVQLLLHTGVVTAHALPSHATGVHFLDANDVRTLVGRMKTGGHAADAHADNKEIARVGTADERRIHRLGLEAHRAVELGPLSLLHRQVGRVVAKRPHAVEATVRRNIDRLIRMGHAYLSCGKRTRSANGKTHQSCSRQEGAARHPHRRHPQALICLCHRAPLSSFCSSKPHHGSVRKKRAASREERDLRGGVSRKNHCISMRE